MLIPLLLGSESDQPFAAKIINKLDELKIPYEIHVGSAHKKTRQVLNIIEKYNEKEKICFITIAGRSNALSGVTAANTKHPVIACPPHKDKTDYLVNIHSTLQMPSETPVLTVVDPVNAALAAARILKS